MSEPATITPAAPSQTPAGTGSNVPAGMYNKPDVTPAPAAKPDEKPVAAEPAKPAEPAKAPSPVSTTKPSIISDAGKPATEGKPAVPAKEAETPEAKAAREATETENKRIMEADEKTLSPEELTKKAELVKAAEDAKKAADAKTVPDKYDIKVPDGMTIDEAVLAEFTPIAKELGLTNEAVQKLADFQAKQISKITTAAQAAQKQAFESFIETTTKESVDFFGAKLDGMLPYVAKGRDQFANEGVMAKLEATGLSNDKDFILMFDKMGRTVSEHKLVEGKPVAASDQRTPGSIMYAKDK